MMVVVMLLGNTKHSPGTVLSALQIGDLPILQTRKQIQRSSYSEEVAEAGFEPQQTGFGVQTSVGSRV